MATLKGRDYIGGKYGHVAAGLQPENKTCSREALAAVNFSTCRPRGFNLGYSTLKGRGYMGSTIHMWRISKQM